MHHQWIREDGYGFIRSSASGVLGALENSVAKSTGNRSHRRQEWGEREEEMGRSQGNCGGGRHRSPAEETLGKGQFQEVS
jgi:hypothetical protein